MILVMVIDQEPNTFALFGFLFFDWAVFLTALFAALLRARKLQLQGGLIEELLATPIPSRNYFQAFFAAPIKAFFLVVIAEVAFVYIDLGIDEAHWWAIDRYHTVVAFIAVPALIWFHGHSIALAHALVLPLIGRKSGPSFNIGGFVALGILIAFGLTVVGVAATYFMLFAAVRWARWLGDSDAGMALALVLILAPGFFLSGWLKGVIARRQLRRFVARLEGLSVDD